MLRYVVSFLFSVQMYCAMPVIGLAYAPMAMFSKKYAYAACHAYSRWVMWTARWMLGITCEVRGDVPQGEVLVPAKHQSFLDILMIFSALPQAKFIMKKEILWMPVIGQYSKRMQMVAVDRGKRGKAIAKMLADVHSGRQTPGQLVIYPQGTRVAPGVHMPYKTGAAALYEQLGQPCVPVATNVGLFWPRRGILRKPGNAVVEFLPPIPPGLSRSEFLQKMEQSIEEASDALMRESRERMERLETATD